MFIRRLPYLKTLRGLFVRVVCACCLCVLFVGVGVVLRVLFCVCCLCVVKRKRRSKKEKKKKRERISNEHKFHVSRSAWGETLCCLYENDIIKKKEKKNSLPCCIF